MYPAAQFEVQFIRHLKYFAKYEDASDAVKLEQSYLAFQRHLHRNKEVLALNSLKIIMDMKEVLDNYIQQYPIPQVSDARMS